MKLFSLTTTSGSSIGIPSNDIIAVRDIGSSREVQRKSSGNILVTQSLAVFNDSGYFTTVVGGVDTVINSIYTSNYQADSNPLKTKVTLNGTYLIVDNTIAEILVLLNSAPSTNNIVGEVRVWSAGVAPSGWLLLDGTTISQATYADLYAVVGDAYTAVPNGTTFDLPDSQGRVIVGVGGSFTLGLTGGLENTTLLEANLPAHSHGVNCYSLVGNNESPRG